MDKLIQQLKDLKSAIEHAENVINFIDKKNEFNIILQPKNDRHDCYKINIYHLPSKLQGKIINLIYKYYQKEYKRMILKKRVITFIFGVKDFLLNKIIGG